MLSTRTKLVWSLLLSSIPTCARCHLKVSRAFCITSFIHIRYIGWLYWLVWALMTRGTTRVNRFSPICRHRVNNFVPISFWIKQNSMNKNWNEDVNSVVADWWESVHYYLFIWFIFFYFFIYLFIYFFLGGGGGGGGVGGGEASLRLWDAPLSLECVTKQLVRGSPDTFVGGGILDHTFSCC